MSPENTGLIDYWHCYKNIQVDGIEVLPNSESKEIVDLEKSATGVNTVLDS